MSADKRKKILVGFAGIAAVLLVIITYVSPTFRDENASGAIGAVKKHRQPQIAQKDVVLGNEQLRQTQNVIYADFLSDAATLRSVSADVLAAQSVDSQSRFVDAASRLDNQQAEVQAQFVENMRGALNALQGLGKASLENFESEMSALQAALANQNALESEDMARLNLSLENVIKSLDSEIANASYASMSQTLGKAAELAQKNSLEAARSELGRAAAQLNAASSLGLQYRSAHLDAMVKEMKALENVEEALSLASKSAENRSIENAFDEASAALGKAASELESQALNNMDRSLASAEMADAALRNVSAALASMQKTLDSNASEYDAATLQNYRSSLDSLSRELNNHALENQSRAAMEAQSAALNRHLAGAKQLDAAARENITAQLAQISSALENKSAVASVSR